MDLLPRVFTIVLADDGKAIDLVVRPISGVRETGSAVNSVRNLIQYTGSTLEGNSLASAVQEGLLNSVILDSPHLSEQRKAEIFAILNQRKIGDVTSISKPENLPGYRAPIVTVGEGGMSKPASIVVYYIDP